METSSRVQYELRRSSRRRSVSIKVQPDASVIVSVPSWMGNNEIRRIVDSKEAWIRKYQEKFSSIYRNTIYREYKKGESFFLFGEPYTLQDSIEKVSLPVFQEHKKILLCSTSDSMEKRKTEIRNLYRTLGRQYIEEHLERLLLQVQDETCIRKMPTDVRCRSMKRRWGSCSSKGVITLSIRLFGAPPEVINYVLIHELVHLYHFSHGREFFKLLTKLVPDWKEKKQSLDQMSPQLVL